MLIYNALPFMAMFTRDKGTIFYETENDFREKMPHSTENIESKFARQMLTGKYLTSSRQQSVCTDTLLHGKLSSYRPRRHSDRGLLRKASEHERKPFGTRSQRLGSTLQKASEQMTYDVAFYCTHILSVQPAPHACRPQHTDKKRKPRECLPLRAFRCKCWITRIRTWTNRTKTCCATITP